MINLTDLNKKFGRQEVLKHVSFRMQEGQTVALMGPNGSGKTTLIKCILGMVRPDKGTILFDDKNIARDWNYRRDIGYMPQAANFPGRIKVKELIDMMTDLRGIKNKNETDRELLEVFELDKIYDKRIGTLSGGTKQKVSAALAFLFNPKMLILDEPTTGLDPVSSEVLKQKIIRECSKDKLILVSSHIISDVEEVSTHVMYLFEGTVQFIKELEILKLETGERSLNKAIVSIMTHQNPESKHEYV
jgi:Cu-processing system ATP-binding protein